MDFSWKISLAAKWIKAGQVIAYPTESVYGLGCNPKNLPAVQQILDIKQRSYKKGLILVASNIEQMIPYMDNPTPQMIARILTPSDTVTTWVIPANKNLSSLLTGEQQTNKQVNNKTIAMRLSKHPVIFSLCQKLGHPIVSTSANKTGKAMCWSALAVKLHFRTKIKYILNAPSGKSTKPSEIRDILSNQIMRG
ncbi:MAG: L-threonylcarbamoyladenylate synthase [Pseudomonadota bacterium]